jgi:hypothetical protein
MAKEYSPELCQYLGKIELDASQARDSFARYMVFNSALESLSRAGLPDEDSRLARGVLQTRARETKPWNIGCASGEAGEAD